MFLPGLDLNSESAFCDPVKNFFAGVIDAYRQVDLRSVDGTSAINNLPSLCGPLRRTPQGQAFQLPGSISLDGVCATDVSREPARYRSLSSRSVFQALPPGSSRDCSAQCRGQRQRDSGLAHLLRLRSESDRNGTTALRQRTFWSRAERHRLRSGRHHHRSVPLGFSLGAVPFDQGRYQAAYFAGLERQYPFFHSYQRWEVARDQRARRVDYRAWGFLRDGSRLHRFRAFGATERGRQLLCHSCQVQSQSPAPLLPQSRQIDGADLRPNRDAHRLLLAPRFRCTAQTSQVQRSREWKNFGLSDQQLRIAGADHYPALPLSLADRVVFQVDQAASSYQGLLWHHRERSQNSNLDRRLCLRPDCHRQKTAQRIGQSLRTPTDFESYCFRKSSAYSTVYSTRPSPRFHQSAKPVEFIQITLGHYCFTILVQRRP